MRTKSMAVGIVLAIWVGGALSSHAGELNIVNPGFETDPAPSLGATGWTITSGGTDWFTTTTNLPDSSVDPAAAAEGVNWLSGNRLVTGAGSSSNPQTLEQLIDISSDAGLVDTGTAAVNLDFMFADNDSYDTATINIYFYSDVGGTTDIGTSLTTGAIEPTGPEAGSTDRAPWDSRSFSGTIPASARSLKIEIVNARSNGSAGNTHFDEFSGSIGQGEIGVISRYPTPDAELTTNDFPLALGTILLDGISSVDTGSIELILDSNTVTLVVGDVVKNATTTTVSHVVSSLDLGPHTLSLVYAGTSPAVGPYTNTWSFFVKGEEGNRVYVDVTTNNTVQLGGSGYSTFNPDGIGSNWTTRAGYGNYSTVFQSQYTSNSPTLKTTVSGLASGTYKVYAYMWAAGSSANWRMEASTNDTSLALYYQSDYPFNQTNLYVHYQDVAGADPWGNFTSVAETFSTDLASNPFGSSAVKLARQDRRLVEIYLGTVTGTEISVYVDDDANGYTGEERTWYDGVGYELIAGGEPSVDPVIQSFNIDGTTISLEWTSESVATYRIMLKTNLTDTAWTLLKSGIAGGEPTTSGSADVGSATTGFYRIEGE